MHRTTELSGTGKVLKFSQRARERATAKKGMDLLMPATAEKLEFRLLLLHEEIRWLHNWLERGAAGKFHLRDPMMAGGWLVKTEDGKIGIFNAKSETHLAWAEHETLQRLMLKESAPNTYLGALLLQRMGQQDYM